MFLLQIRVLCNGLTETLGRLRFSRSWKTNFTAHPKIDPVNGTAGIMEQRNVGLTGRSC